MTEQDLIDMAYEFGYGGESLDALYQWSFENKVQVTPDMLEAYEEGHFDW